MRPIELKDLISGLLVLIGITIAVGKFDKLHDFAKHEAVKSLRGWPAHRFFPLGYKPPGFKAI